MTMASLPMFKTAILGTGGIARAHAEALIAIGMPPLACADVVPGRAAVFAQRYHIPSAYDSVQELLEHHRLDIVGIATPPPAHLENIAALTAAGVRGVNLEKPMATDLATADAMIDACARAGTLLVVNHQRRFLKQQSQARAWIDAGRIGHVTDVVCGVDGDLLHDGTHIIDLTRFYVADDPVVRVFGGLNLDGTNAYGKINERWPAGTRYGHAVDSSCLGQLRFRNGVRAVNEVGYEAIRPNRAYTDAVIRGEAGTIEMDTPACGDAGVRITMYGQAPQADPSIGSRVEGAWEQLDGEFHRLAFGRVYTRLAECIAVGSADHPLHALSARADLEIIMALFESSRQRRAIELPVERGDSPLEELLGATERVLATLR